MEDKKIITVIRDEGVRKKDGAFRILIDGKPDPRNYQFVSYDDIAEWFEFMQSEGLYTDCVLRFPPEYVPPTH